jgi:hypothetical protein
MSRKPKLRSPLKEEPLHYAGESTMQMGDNKLFLALNFFLVALMTGYMYAAMWYEHVHPDTFDTSRGTLIFILIIGALLLFVSLTIRKHALRYYTGSQGERYVAQILDPLRRFGCEVFHDIVNGHGNIDHVVISPQGIFTIETKTHSKHEGQPNQVLYDGIHLYENGYQHDEYISQACGEAGWLRDKLGPLDGKPLLIKPVLVFPGWYCRTLHHDPDKAWVLKPENLALFMSNVPDHYTGEQVRELAERMRLLDKVKV